MLVEADDVIDELWLVDLFMAPLAQLMTMTMLMFE